MMMMMMFARRRSPSLNLMLLSLMRTLQLLDDDDGYDLYIKKGVRGRSRRSILSSVSNSLTGFRCLGLEWVFWFSHVGILTYS
ncbi:hypothetical protein OIU77_019911 [Salix suchowensis]|uniref:Secreted protein n=1 Tax=Salix suchowensis TaxID=1278906 RepID=A0ABQ9CHR7_9ROSI|nr:hypothetical protein OIU78_021902 [Salix suchowensis]KAJ6399259.1 hypothetical protein OIU77_019911 [Salix suchowensis]